MRWWGIGRGYFRNALSIALLMLLAATLIALLSLRRYLAPLMITSDQQQPASFAKRVLVRAHAEPTSPTLGDWMVFATICDSCAALVLQSTPPMSDTCTSVLQLYRQVQRCIATQLNQFGWSADEFRFYLRRSLAFSGDSTPHKARWIQQCSLLHPPSRHSVLPSQDTLLRYVMPLLQGRLWWIELGLAEPLSFDGSSGNE